MTDLQLSLILIGVLIIVGVYAFNKLQEKRLRKKLEQQLKSEHVDVLLQQEPAVARAGGGTSRIEPAVGGEASREERREVSLPTRPDTPPTRRIEPAEPAYRSDPEPVRPIVAEKEIEPESDIPVVVAAAEEPAPKKRMAAAPELPLNAPVDEEIQLVATMHAGELIMTDSLAVPHRKLASAGKPVYWMGLNHLTQQWEEIDLDHFAEYEQLKIGMQLADRTGHATESQLASFCEAVQKIAQEFVAVVECADKSAALERARRLDDFCAEVDVLVGINVIADTGRPFAGSKIRGVAESAGMVLAPEGQFLALDEAGRSQFAIANHEEMPFTAEGLRDLTTHGLTFLFDVPKAAGGLVLFDRMVQAASKFAASLGGTLVDDNRRPLTPEGLERIKQQLSGIYTKMESQHIVPGSRRATQLFS